MCWFWGRVIQSYLNLDPYEFNSHGARFSHGSGTRRWKICTYFRKSGWKLYSFFPGIEEFYNPATILPPMSHFLHLKKSKYACNMDNLDMSKQSGKKKKNPNEIMIQWSKGLININPHHKAETKRGKQLEISVPLLSLSFFSLDAVGITNVTYTCTPSDEEEPAGSHDPSTFLVSPQIGAKLYEFVQTLD